MRSTEDLKGKKLGLYIYLNENCRAKGFVYLNDGHSTDYQHGEHTLHQMEYDGKEIRSTQKIGEEFDISKMIGKIEIFA